MTVKCLCAFGYELQIDERTCQKPSQFLIFFQHSMNNPRENSGLFRAFLSFCKPFTFEQIELMNSFNDHKFNTIPTSLAIDSVYFFICFI